MLAHLRSLGKDRLILSHFGFWEGVEMSDRRDTNRMPYSIKLIVTPDGNLKLSCSIIVTGRKGTGTVDLVGPEGAKFGHINVDGEYCISWGDLHIAKAQAYELAVAQLDN